MPVYLLATIDIGDRETYGKYEAGFMEIFSKHEGQLLSVEENAKVLEGEWTPTRTVLARFPDEAAARRWYESPEYQELAKFRHAASSGNIILTRGLG